MRPSPVLAAILATAVVLAAEVRADDDASAPRTPSVHLRRAGDATRPAASAPEAKESSPDSPSRGLVGALGAIDAPNGPALGRDLSKIDENGLLLPGDHAALRGVADGSDAFHADREPLILVHGIEGDPKDLQAVADRLATGPFQEYVLCYDDYHRRTSENGIDLAAEVRRLARRLGPGRDVTFVAHSMGGIVVRRALNELAFGPDRGIEQLGRVRFIAIDTPWHGYPGPSDTGIDGVFMDIARAFLPAGLDDMRARSAMFQGDPHDANPAERKGLIDPLLPDSVEIELVFAKEGTVVLDYAKGKLRDLAGKLADHYAHEAPVRGDPMLVNEWKALLSSKQYFAFADEMDQLTGRGALDAAAVEAALERHFPQFPGDHTGVLREHPGEVSLLDHLAEELGCPRAATPRAP